jgi:hypothetical protein
MKIKEDATHPCRQTTMVIFVSVSLHAVTSQIKNSIQWTFPLITKILIWTKMSSQLERASQNW